MTSRCDRQRLSDGAVEPPEVQRFESELLSREFLRATSRGLLSIGFDRRAELVHVESDERSTPFASELSRRSIARAECPSRSFARWSRRRMLTKRLSRAKEQ